jgi:hypothetical protein
MYCAIILPLFLQCLPDIENLISCWSITPKSTKVIPNNFICMWSYPSEKNVWYNFIWSWEQWYVSVITTVSFIAVFVNRYRNWLFPLVRQFFFVPDQLNKLMNLWTQYFPSCFDQFCWNAWIKLINFFFKCFISLFLKTLPVSRLVLHKLPSITSLRSCNRCSLACFLRSTNLEHPSSNHGL